ncbi:PilZ domain-containing protein [Candidatus Sumerlaeota bacterium]|nr:PilZ domain-containing protein [Candidatus Sumerlaeota bacterium]
MRITINNSSDENRKYKRYAGKFKVSFSVLSGKGATPFEFGKCLTMDISRGGARLLLDESISTPIMIQLNISIPNRNFGIFVLGKALYCNERNGSGNMPQSAFEAGIKFVGLLPPDFEHLLTTMA